jgi:hypothetical protein
MQATRVITSSGPLKFTCWVLHSFLIF